MKYAREFGQKGRKPKELEPRNLSIKFRMTPTVAGKFSEMKKYYEKLVHKPITQADFFKIIVDSYYQVTAYK